MTHTLDLLKVAHAKLSAKVAKQRATLESAEVELNEISTAIRVLSRLGVATEAETETATDNNALVMAALGRVEAGAKAPKDIASEIRGAGANISDDNVRTILWRMAKRDAVTKNEAGLYWRIDAAPSYEIDDPEASLGSSVSFAEELLGGNPADPHVSTANPGTGD